MLFSLRRAGSVEKRGGGYDASSGATWQANTRLWTIAAGTDSVLPQQRALPSSSGIALRMAGAEVRALVKVGVGCAFRRIKTLGESPHRPPRRPRPSRPTRRRCSRLSFVQAGQRFPRDARQGRLLRNSRTSSTSINRPSTRLEHRAWNHQSSSTVLVETPPLTSVAEAYFV